MFHHVEDQGSLHFEHKAHERQLGWPLLTLVDIHYEWCSVFSTAIIQHLQLNSEFASNDADLALPSYHTLNLTLNHRPWGSELIACNLLGWQTGMNNVCCCKLMSPRPTKDSRSYRSTIILLWWLGASSMLLLAIALDFGKAFACPNLLFLVVFVPLPSCLVVLVLQMVMVISLRAGACRSCRVLKRRWKRLYRFW